jgi:hypothetical protein
MRLIAAQLLRVCGFLLLLGCASAREEARRPPGGGVRWILVERRAEDLRDALGGEGAGLVPDAPVLVAAPVPPAGARWSPEVLGRECPSVEVLDLVPEGPLGVGEVASARLRVANARPEGLYRIRGQAVGDGTCILGPAEFVVRGPEPVRIAFTSLRAGPGTLRVFAEAIR